MFNFLKNIFKREDTRENYTNKERDNDSVNIASSYAAVDSARISTQEVAKKFSKPSEYDRYILDDGMAKKNIKLDAFSSGVTVRDPYTGDILALTKSEAKMRYGEDWTRHLAEADHKIALEKRYNQTKDNPWLTNEDVRASSNSTDNLEVVSRKFNNAKRSRTNSEFVNDDEYLQKTGVKLSKQGKERAIESEMDAQNALDRRDFMDSARNIIKTGHSAGTLAAQNAGVTCLTMSGILNLTAVIKGEKSAEDAITDTVVDTSKAAATGYVMGGGLTTISHTLSGSSSKFLQALSKSNVPGNIITAVIVTGNTLKRYANGEITTQECMLELGEKGLNIATTSYSMTVGQALIPIPVVGAAVGALVGSILTSNYYSQLVNTLRVEQLEHQERLRIIAECERAAKETRAYRAELEAYLQSYFKEYQDCFDDALNTIHTAFRNKDADGVIAGANQITRKLGGKVHYDNMSEFKDYLFDDTTDIL